MLILHFFEKTKLFVNHQTILLDTSHLAIALQTEDISVVTGRITYFVGL